MALHLPRKDIKYEALAFALVDVQRIFERLLVQVNDQAEVELGALQKQANETDEGLSARKEDLRRRVFRITVTIFGTDGSQLFGDDASLFVSPNRPTQVRSIYMTNVTAYQGVTSQRPINFFELLLDFSRPPLLDPNRLVSSPTANDSNLSVGGQRDAWVAAVVEAVDGVLRERRTRRSWVHRAFIYDVGQLLIGVPLGFYVCLKLSGLVNRVSNIPPFLGAALYVYLFFIALWAYRVLFGYTRWAFPSVELTDNRDSAQVHRAVWWVISGGVLIDVIWEGIKLLVA